MPSKTFVLVIDEDRVKILNIIQTMVELNPLFKNSMTLYGLQEAQKSFFKEIDDKVHELDMCSDKTCVYQKK